VALPKKGSKMRRNNRIQPVGSRFEAGTGFVVKFIFASILVALSGCAGVLGGDLDQYAGGPNAAANATAAHDKLIGRLPIGSNISKYVLLFNGQGGSCVNASDASGGLYMCRYEHSMTVFTKAEWIFEIQYDKLSNASTHIGVNYYVTGL
jgi:hypothetical protein